MSQEQPLESGVNPSGGDTLPAILAAKSDPRALEDLYRSAREAKTIRAYTLAIETAYRETPDNLLFAAWHYRLQSVATDEPSARHGNWRLAIPLSVALALIFWLLSDPGLILAQHVPYLAEIWAPITALALIAFLVFTARQGYNRTALIGIGLIGVTAYALVMALRTVSTTQSQYLTMIALHLPLLAAVAVGLAVLGWGSSARNRFAFLYKSIETIGTAGVAAIAGGIFVGLTYGVFQAISVEIPDVFVRLLIAGGAGLIPVLAVASVYDPTLSASGQDFRRGFGRILTILMRALLPLTLLVLVIYICFIPFNFTQPFNNRNVLIVYNVLLFAIMGLLIGVTPVSRDDVPVRYTAWLRGGIFALAALVTLVSLYALTAIIYRTTQDHLTMNRLVVLGWNIINIAILALLLLRQLRANKTAWVDALQSTFRFGTALYAVWGLLLVLALPWLY